MQLTSKSSGTILLQCKESEGKSDRKGVRNKRGGRLSRLERVMALASNVSSESRNESLFLTSMTYIAAALYWVGSVVAIFHIAVWFGLTPVQEDQEIGVVDYLRSSSTMYMMSVVTLFAVIKDVMFRSVNTQQMRIAAAKYAYSSSRFGKGRKPLKPTVLGLSCTLLITLCLIILHSKGALVKIVESVSSTDFLTTSEIVYTTMESIAEELFSEDIVPSNYKYYIHSHKHALEGVLKRNEFIALCKF